MLLLCERMFKMRAFCDWNLGSVLEGSWRAIIFATEVLPILLHYKHIQFRVRKWDERLAAAAYNELHEHYAPRALAICLHMKGFYIKLGQMAAGGGLGIVPQPYVNELRSLLEDCPALQFSTVRTIVEKDLGALSLNFSEFAEQPINGASIGQVHHATLRNGCDVVVKVQYPGAERNFNVDISCFLAAARALFPQHVELLHEIQKNFINEFDYRKEAKATLEAFEIIERASHFENVVVPFPVLQLCSKHVLVMERLDGQSFSAWGHSQLKQRAQGLTWFATMQTMLISYMPDFAGIGLISRALLEVQAYMIFQVGFFNGDPHPGNLMLLDNGFLALIDWGQVTRLSEEQRCKLARLCIAVAENDELQTAKFMRALGMRTARDLDWTYAKLAQYYLCSWSEDFVEDLGGVLLFEENLNKVDRVIISVGEFHMVFRNQIFCRQSLFWLGYPRIRSVTALHPAAVQFLESHAQPIPQCSYTSAEKPAEVSQLFGH